MATDYDIVVVGGGMAGATLAALLGRGGLEVALLEAHEPRPFDLEAELGLRVSAIAPGSRAILEQAGAWRNITRGRYCPYRRMHVEAHDGSESLDFDAGSYGFDALGYIIENDLTVHALWQTLEATGLVELLCPVKLRQLEQGQDSVRLELSDGRKISATLVAGADGAESRVRRLCNIDQDLWEYNQSGLVAVIQTEKPNPGVAWQRFLSGGPLALLPLADGASSIVWTLPSEAAQQWLAADADEFKAALSAECRSAFGEVIGCSERAAFPLSMRLSADYIRDGVVLLGDAAHVVHPLAGQGVNLGLLDAAALVEVLLQARSANRPLRAKSTLRRYERWRRSEDTLMAQGFHAIRTLYSLPEGPATDIRRLGVNLVRRSWFAREWFLKHATGQHPDAPLLARGTSLRDLTR